MNIKDFKAKAKHTGFLYDFVHKGYEAYLHTQKALYNYKNRERACSYGNENPDKTFYVIGFNYTTAGLFSIVKSIACHVKYALHNGYIPVVDMQNFHSQMSQGVNEGNAWEAYFKQPLGYCLEDIENSKNIIQSASLPYPKGIDVGFDSKIDQSLHDEWHNIYKQYLVPNDTVAAYSDAKFKSVIGDKNKVLGVLCRGTDYTQNKPVGHPIQPTPQQAVEKVRQVIEAKGYEYVFLATEDKSIYDVFNAEFGERLLFSGQKLYESLDGAKYLSDLPISSKSEKWKSIVDYYATIHILTKCNGLVAGLTCGSICAYLMADSYDFVYFWDLGRY